MERKEVLLFDLDGTIVSLEFDLVGSRKKIISKLKKMGFDMEGYNYKVPTQLLIEGAESQAELLGLNFAVVRREIFSILDRFEAISVSRTKLLDNSRSVLERIKKAGIRMGLVTNTGRQALELIMSKFSLDEFFNVNLSRDEVPAMKPRAEGLELALKLMGAERGSAYYVGDSIYDIRAARACGIKSIGVSTGTYSSSKLRNEGADFVIPKISELTEILHL
jgi:HAD superfamily hydrolase (TIGR01549 family)